jgi:hypothetical protein
VSFNKILIRKKSEFYADYEPLKKLQRDVYKNVLLHKSGGIVCFLYLFCIFSGKLVRSKLDFFS